MLPDPNQSAEYHRGWNACVAELERLRAALDALVERCAWLEEKGVIEWRSGVLDAARRALGQEPVTEVQE